MDKKQSKEADDIVAGIMREFEFLSSERGTTNGHWEEVSDLVLPTYRNTFYNYATNTPGEKKTEHQIDSTAMQALSRFAAIMDSMLTPRNSFWHTLEATDPNLNKIRRVKLWFEDTTQRLFRLRYAPTANFTAQNQSIWHSVGAFGNGGMFIDKYLGNDGAQGLRYKAIPLGQVYVTENHQGQVDRFIRCFRDTARNALAQWPDTVPDAIKSQMEKNPDQMFWFLHCVKPRGKDYDPQQIGAKGKRFASYYVSVTGKVLLSEGGYNSFPLAFARDEIAPGEVYGRGPAMRVLPAIKTLNAQKRIVLKQGHRTVDPVLFTHDDGIANVSLKPGAVNTGGVSRDGRLLVQPMPVGNVMVGKDMMDDERAVIEDAFLVRLFQILYDEPAKVYSATQVIEMANQKGILLAPTTGRFQSGYLGPAIERELDVALDLGLLAPMPPELIEARGDYQVVYTSPMSRLAKAEENTGFLRSVEVATNVFNVTQDPSVMDRFNFDVALPEIAANNGAPERWMHGDDVVAAKREQRAQQRQIEQQIAAAPGAAAMMKAEVAAKNGKTR